MCYGIDEAWRHFIGWNKLIFVQKHKYMTSFIGDMWGGNENPLQYSCLENSMDREAWSMGSQELDTTNTYTQTHTQEKVGKTNSQRESGGWVPEAREGSGELVFNGEGASVWEAEEVLPRMAGMATPVWICLMPLSCALRKCISDVMCI